MHPRLRAQLPLVLDELRVRAWLVRSKTAGYLYMRGRAHARVVEFVRDGRAVQYWMAPPFADARLEELERQATAAGCGELAPLGVWIERALDRLSVDDLSSP